MVKVIHIRQADFNNPSHIYIGRPGKGQAGSPLANPYRLNGDAERDGVLMQYENWLWRNLRNGTPQMAEIQRLIQLHDELGELNLVCFCAPKRCHGDYIKLAIESGVYDE